MRALPKKCLVDTNVPIIANRAFDQNIPDDLQSCVLACVEAIEHVVNKGSLVMDSENEIFDEYLHELSLKGQPGVGDKFMKWVHDNRWGFPNVDRVTITKDGDSYVEFPDHDGLADFDISDRKFIAVSNAHPGKPPILQAVDSKWWGWKDALGEAGVTVNFLCPDYVKSKYAEKIGA